MLIVDDRWGGKHGIGRLAREIVPRIENEWTPLKSRLSPTSPFDAVNVARFKLTSKDLIYSPGFNAGLTSARQLVTICDLIHLDVPTESSLAKRIYYERVVKPAVVRSGIVLTISEVSRAAISDWLAAPSVKIVNAGIGLSQEFKVDGPIMKPFDHYFMYVGNIKPHKNFNVVLEALRLRPDYRLVVICADSYGVAARAQAAGVAQQIETRSNIEDADLAALYRGSDGLVFPSMLEGFGLPALEAGSSGANVAFWAGCKSIAEILDGRGVTVADAHDANAWADAMDELCARGPLDPLPWWKEQYDWDLSSQRVDAAISSAL